MITTTIICLLSVLIIGLAALHSRILRVESRQKETSKSAEHLVTTSIHEFKEQNLTLQAELKKVQTELKATKSRLAKFEKSALTPEQIDFQEKLDAKYIDFHKETLNAANEQLIIERESFQTKLKEEFEKACDEIKFNEIEYKKTITKKRKEYNRKNTKNAKPQRKWRYIDED